MGSRALAGVPSLVVAFLEQLPVDTTILLRRGNYSGPGNFELLVAECCQLLWIPFEWCLPDLVEGPSATFLRDVAMVKHSDCVLAFFADEMMSGGTEHVVEKAIDAGVPVYAYGVRDGQFIRIGEHDPDASWIHLAPVP